MYDMAQFKQIRAFKVGTPQASYPVCIGVQRHESYNVLRGFAVGLLNKTVRYYAVDQNQNNNPVNWLINEKHKTAIENYKPYKIKFLNQICFVAFDDCTKVLDFRHDGDRPQLLDIIRKPIGKVFDFRISEDYS